MYVILETCPVSCVRIHLARSQLSANWVNLVSRAQIQRQTSTHVVQRLTDRNTHSYIHVHTNSQKYALIDTKKEIQIDKHTYRPKAETDRNTHSNIHTNVKDPNIGFKQAHTSSNGVPHADLQIDRKKDTKKDRKTQRQTDKQTNIQTYKHTNRQTDKQTNRQTDKQTNRQTDKETNRQTDKQTNRQFDDR